MSDKEDAFLVRSFKEGDESAFDRLFEKYMVPIYSICYRYTRNEADARDLYDEDEGILPTTEVFEKMKARIRFQKTLSRPTSRLTGILSKVLVPALVTAALLLIFLWPRNGTVEFSIPVTDLIEDEEIAATVLMGTIDKRMVEELVAVEDYFLPTTEEAIDELTINEREALIVALNRKYPFGT